MGLSTKLAWDDPRVWHGGPPGAIPPGVPGTTLPTFYGATVGLTRPPQDAAKLGEVAGETYYLSPQWGYLRSNEPGRRKPREASPPPYTIVKIARDKVPPSLLPVPGGPPPSTFPWETILLIVLAFLMLRRQT